MKNIKLAFLTAALLFSAPLSAANFFLHQWAETPQVFTLEISQTDYPILLDQHHSSALVQRLRGELMDISNPYVHGGILLGKLQVDQDNYPPSEGVPMAGYFVGFSLRHVRPLTTNWLFGMQGEYLYQTAEGDSGNKTSKLAWHQWQGRAGALWQASRRWALYGGGQLQLLRGQSIYNQPSSQTDPLDELYFPNIFIGLDLRIENTGHIGLEATTIDSHGLALYFQRQY